MTTKTEKKMIGNFYKLTEEAIGLREKIAKLEDDLVKSNHRNLDLQYIVDSLDKENQEMNVFRVAVANALQRPAFCSLENLTRYAIEDIAYLQKENRELKAQIVMYKRSIEIGDD